MSLSLYGQSNISDYVIEYNYYTPLDYEISKDTINSFLYFNDKQSLFEMNKKEYDPKSLKFNEDDEVVGDEVLFKDQVYKNYLNDLMLSNSDILFQKKVLLSQTLNDFEIIEKNSQDVKIILGYKCISATITYKERKYKVYYSQEIETSFGPWKFHGLEGLILEVISEDELLYIKAKDIKKVKVPFENPFENKQSHSWETIITKASIKYARKLEEMQKCCSQNSSIDFSNNLESYSLNPNFSIEILYNVYIEFKDKKVEERSLNSTFVLKTTTAESNYVYQEKVRNEQNLSNYGYVSEKGFLYKDLIDSILLQDKELRGKKFLIKDSIPNFDWQITDEIDNILNFRVRKAKLNLNDNIIYAWYSPDLPLNNGPDIYSGLPGIVLKLKIIYNPDKETSETRFYEAFSINQVEKPTIIVPNKGEIVSYKEFKNLQKESYKKMMEMFETGVDKSD